MLEDLLVVGYYTMGTPYQEEAKGLINSCKKLGLNHDITGVRNLGNWQANTKIKAGFMLSMLEKHPDKRLLYVDCDAVINSMPVIFENYSADIAVRRQDFGWKKDECLSGTIYMENNERTRQLCNRWIAMNKTQQGNKLEQWNLGEIITDMSAKNGLVFKNLPAEYTFIFDIMKKIYPTAIPVIEHFQASRRFKKKL